MDFIVNRVHSGPMIFSSFCREAGTEVLLDSDSFIDLRDGPLGFELHYNCYCGRTGILYPKLGTGSCGERQPSAA